ncbi:hypothetical protein G7Z17_g3375 [Cylindrodendrum hubeiense]|uniref:Uncharacterized protein n=1 Tax=Cylindrodendrum hubeiense TaxID=595255 RepID=A0A9P5HFZ5_9HYPO|nr:hypothetical protein G7Z17_g3375 [Cylindrodendrum hubeiense]
MRHVSAVLAAFVAIAKVVSADEVILTYQTATITQCYANTGVFPSLILSCPTPVVAMPENTGLPICVNVQAPDCHACDCDTCVHTLEYLTAFNEFCTSGLRPRVYAVTETYSGMSETPCVTSGSIPLGFTREVQTCTTCGPEPITATITHPISDHPYITGISEPSPAPDGAKSYEIDFNPNGQSSDSPDVATATPTPYYVTGSASRPNTSFIVGSAILGFFTSLITMYR